MKPLLVTIFFVSIAGHARSQYDAYRKLYFSEGETKLPYRLLSPMVASQSYPPVVFLHGAAKTKKQN